MDYEYRVEVAGTGYVLFTCKNKEIAIDVAKNQKCHCMVWSMSAKMFVFRNW